MLPARALFYALIISLLIAMITASLVGLTYFYQSHLDENLLEESMIRNLKSGLALLLEEEEATVPQQKKDLFDQESTDIQLAKYEWGLFSVAWVETIPNPLVSGIPVLRKIALIGEEINTSLIPALYLADNRSPLALSGTTTIRGSAYLPQAGVKRGYVDGQSYLGDQLIYGATQVSSSAIPEIPKGRIKRMMAFLNTGQGGRGISSPMRQSFRDSTVYLSGPSLNLSGLDLSGRIVVRAIDTIFVGRDSRLEDVILVAPTILFENGFRGTLQAFASKKIIIGEGVFLGYPSVVGLVKDKPSLPNNRNFMEIQESSEIRGLVFTYSEVYSRVPERLLIKEGALVRGQVVVEGNLELKGRVAGNVTCSQFVLRTAASIYSNHLHNAVIDRPALESYYCSPFFYNTGAFPQKIVKWIN